LEQLQQASKAWDDYRYHDFGGTQVEQVPISIPDNMDTVIMKFQKQIEQQNNHHLQK